jgi:hypothetical protein
VLVGGAPLNEEFGKAVGADAYCRDAGIAVETAKRPVAAAIRPYSMAVAPDLSARNSLNKLRHFENSNSFTDCT